MKTFKKFLNEQLLFEDNFLTILEDLHSDESGGFYDFHKHGNHEVKVDFDHYGNKRYNVNFAVDGKMSHNRRVDNNTDENRRILHHVHKAVHNFIKEKKPNTLLFTACDNNVDKQTHKGTVYQKAAEHLAKHYGGRAEHMADNFSAVHFNWDHK